MSDAPARFTRWGTAISPPMEAAAETLGAAVFGDMSLAWEALRLRREHNRDRAADRARTVRNGNQLVGDDIAEYLWQESPLWGETGARGYFPGADDAVLVDAREGRIGTHYAHGSQLVTRRIAVYRKARRAVLMSAPPMSGGSPWAARDTGWHADGCLCRSCR